MGYQLIEEISVGSGGAASIEFTGIPQDGVSLVCVIAGRTTSTNPSMRLNLNDSAGDFTGIRLTGTGFGVLSTSETVEIGVFTPSNFTSNTFGNTSIYFSNYTSSANKSISVDSINENNATNATIWITAVTWANTQAITKIKLFSLANLAIDSTASLYKITAD